MSALLPIADIDRLLGNVRFVPEAEVAHSIFGLANRHAGTPVPWLFWQARVSKSGSQSFAKFR
jgi:hypothetical protein